MNNLISDDYLIHHGIKGMKWGVRKRNETEGFRKASLINQKREVQRARKKYRTGKITKSQYKTEASRIKTQGSIDRGRMLVENSHQTYGKVIAKGIAKQAAVSLGSSVVYGMASATGSPMLASYSLLFGGATQIALGVNDVRRLAEIHSYNASKSNR